MRVTITGATGRVGSALVRRLLDRGDEVTVLSRDPGRARTALPGVEAAAWDPGAGPAPADALSGRDGVVHLAGENLAQRWTDDAKRRIMESRERGTRHLVDGLEAADPRPGVLVSASGSGYYGQHANEPVTEDAPPGDDFIARVCVVWEREAERAAGLGIRVVRLRAGVVLDRGGGALAKMLPFFRLGVGGPVAGGRQYLPWIEREDLVGMQVAALESAAWTGPINATAEPVTNRDFAHALGRALGRPAVLPVPALALQLLYGEMSAMVTTGQRAVPERARELGFALRHPDLDGALRVALRD